MSHEFIQTEYYPVYEKTGNIRELQFDSFGHISATLNPRIEHKSAEQYKADVEKLMNRRINVALMAPLIDPEDDRMTYLKGLTEATVNLLHEVSHNMKFDKLTNADINSKETVDHIPEQMLLMLRTAADTLQWMINSTSWREGKELLPFDKFELQRKFGLLSKYCGTIR